MLSSRGIRKTSEQTLFKGRGVIVTEKDKTKYNWDEIPIGSKFIDEVTGIEQVKIKDVLIDKKTGQPIGYGIAKDGKIYYADRKTPILKYDGTQYKVDEVEYSEQSDWVPAGIKNDGTLCIAKDGMIVKESFTIYKTNDGSGNLVYANKRGEYRHLPLGANGEYVFELESGSYIKGRNHLEIVIDDRLHRSAHNGGVIELTEKRFAIPEALKVGQKVEATYIRIARIGYPYPRIFMDKDRPPDSEKGDIWLDFDGFIDTDLGIFIDKKILDDEVLDSGLQPAEAHTPPDDVEPGEKNRPKDTAHDTSGAVILKNSNYKMSSIYPADYGTMFNVPEKLNTTALTTGEGMFQGCTNLKYIPTIDTSKFTSMKNMFNGCLAMYNNDAGGITTTSKEFPWVINCAGITSIEGLRDMFKSTTVNRISFTNVKNNLVNLIDFSLLGANNSILHIEINGNVAVERLCV